MTTNEFERDLNDQSGLKRAGRVDFRVLQNTADAGDGHPGVQRCFRNYLHEGGMEKDLDLIGYSIKGTSVDINNAEMQQLSNIGASVITSSIWTQVSNIGAAVITASIWSQLDNIEATTISPAQWVFVGQADQDVRQADSPTFGGLTINGNIIITGNVDGVTVSTHTHSGAGQGGTVSYANLSNRGHILSGGDHTASGLTIGHVIRASGATTFAWAQLGHGDLSSIGTNSHSAIDTHIGDFELHDGIQLIKALPFDGFVEAQMYGNCFNVVISDTDAYVEYTFFVRNAGTYSVNVFHSTDDDIYVTTQGLLYVGSYEEDDDITSWNVVNGGNFDWAAGGSGSTDKMIIDTYGSNVTLKANSKVTVRWKKDGGTGIHIISIHDIVLNRVT